ncbi:histone methylation protein DOT1 [Aureococcus anophagefferens]|nr:histone methylation protein DOT1 [Aureococcus anophagefferens]
MEAARALAALLAAAVVVADDPPRVMAWTPSGRDGFGSQYFGHMAVFGACRRVPGNGCCYVHQPISKVEHGLAVHSAEQFTGMRSDARCADHSPSGRQRPGNLVVPQFPKPMEVKWYFLRDPDVRRELRAMYDAGAGKAGLEEHDCAYRIHVRRGDHGSRPGHAGVIGNGSYACLARSILRADPGAKICVYSEGHVGDFGELGAVDGVAFHLGGDPYETFHNFVTAEHLFVAHSLLSGAAAVLAVQARIYTVPYEPTMSAALAECWPGDCDCGGYYKRSRRCCKAPNRKVVEVMDGTDVWTMFGLSAARVADERARNDTSWAPKAPSIWPDWWPDPVEEHRKKLEARARAKRDRENQATAPLAPWASDPAVAKHLG